MVRKDFSRTNVVVCVFVCVQREEYSHTKYYKESLENNLVRPQWFLFVGHCRPVNSIKNLLMFIVFVCVCRLRCH